MNGIEDTLGLDFSRNFLGTRKKGITENILLFCRVLKSLKIKITMGRVLDVFKSLKYINLSHKDELYYALRANLISEKDKIPIFDEAFLVFWMFLKQAGVEDDVDEFGRNLEELIEKACVIDEWNMGSADGELDKLEKRQIPVYSPAENLNFKDFSAFTDEDAEKIEEEIIKIANKIATKKSRRKRVSPKGRNLSLRHTLRKSMRSGGEIFKFARTKRKIRKIKVITLADVSGSMDCYSNFFLQFIYHLQQRVKGIETFVFSTRLTRITDIFLNSRTMDKALCSISKTVRHWSGGTKIGFCLETLNHDFSHSMLDDKSVVIIISDGWDRGDTNLLSKEMKRLRDNCRKLIWLNPLMSSQDYQPLCKGIKSAQPYISHHLPFYNLQSLKDLSKLL